MYNPQNFNGRFDIDWFQLFQHVLDSLNGYFKPVMSGNRVTPQDRTLQPWQSPASQVVSLSRTSLGPAWAPFIPTGNGSPAEHSLDACKAHMFYFHFLCHASLVLHVFVGNELWSLCNYQWFEKRKAHFLALEACGYCLSTAEASCDVELLRGTPKLNLGLRMSY